MDGRETIVDLVVLFITALLLLWVVAYVLLKPQTVEMLFQHTTVFELVVGSSLMVRARLF